MPHACVPIAEGTEGVAEIHGCDRVRTEHLEIGQVTFAMLASREVEADVQQACIGVAASHRLCAVGPQSEPE